jgi:hypothetical protein
LVTQRQTQRQRFSSPTILRSRARGAALLGCTAKGASEWSRLVFGGPFDPMAQGALVGAVLALLAQETCSRDRHFDGTLNYATTQEARRAPARQEVLRDDPGPIH